MSGRSWVRRRPGGYSQPIDSVAWRTALVAMDVDYGGAAVTCADMGAKTALLIYADGDVAQALRHPTELDRAATEALVARLVPGLDVVAVEDGNLDWNIHPANGLLYAGVFPGLTVICVGELGITRVDLR